MKDYTYTLQIHVHVCVCVCVYVCVYSLTRALMDTRACFKRIMCACVRFGRGACILWPKKKQDTKMRHPANPLEVLYAHTNTTTTHTGAREEKNRGHEAGGKLSNSFSKQAGVKVYKLSRHTNISQVIKTSQFAGHATRSKLHASGAGGGESRKRLSSAAHTPSAAAAGGEGGGGRHEASAAAAKAGAAGGGGGDVAGEASNVAGERQGQGGGDLLDERKKRVCRPWLDAVFHALYQVSLKNRNRNACVHKRNQRETERELLVRACRACVRACVCT